MVKRAPSSKTKKTSKPAYKKQRTLLAPGQEKKYNTITLADDASTTPSYNQLTTIATGATSVTRIGNKIKTKYVHVRLSFSNEATTAANKLRIMIIIDKNAIQTNYVVGDVLDQGACESQRSIANFSRFHILADDVVVLNTNGGSVINKGFYEKFVRVPEAYSITAFADGTSAIPVSNGISVMYFGDIAAGAADCDIAGTVRLCYLG